MWARPKRWRPPRPRSWKAPFRRAQRACALTPKSTFAVFIGECEFVLSNMKAGWRTGGASRGLDTFPGQGAARSGAPLIRDRSIRKTPSSSCASVHLTRAVPCFPVSFLGVHPALFPLQTTGMKQARLCCTTIDRRRRDQAEMHGSGRSAIDKYNLEPMDGPCGGAGAMPHSQSSMSLRHSKTRRRCSTESPARSPGRTTKIDLGQPRDRALFVSFDFLNPLICTAASSARSHASHGPARTLRLLRGPDRARPRRAVR
jgi:hypothetical protein